MNILKLKILALFIFLGACTDLEEKPVGLLSPGTFFKTKKDVETAVLGTYGILASEPLYGRQFVSALMLRSDMVDIGNRSTAAERIQVNDFTMDSNNGMVRAFWPAWYQVISGANAAVAGAQTLGLAEADINPLIAEARFVRAFSYYHLVRVFGPVPLIDFFVTKPDEVRNLTRASEDAIYTKILEDLTYARQWLPDRQPNNTRSRPTKGTAAAYLASVFLTRGDYQQAYDQAKYVIDNKQVFDYALEADFQNLFRAPLANTLKETIFTMDFLAKRNQGLQNDDLMAPMTGVLNHQTGFGVLVPSLKVYQTWDERDYRRKVSFEDTLVVNGVKRAYTTFTTPRPHIAKWRRFPGDANADGRYSDHNYPDFRYAEVLLIAAEALAELSGPTAEARGYVNEVRKRARNWAGQVRTFPEDVPDNLMKAEFIDLVLEERRLELAFEFKRWYDIKRRNLGPQVFGANGLEPRTAFDPSRDYLMPLPLVDLNINPNLLPNNPGY